MLFVIVYERAGDVDNLVRKCSSQPGEEEFAEWEKNRSENAIHIFGNVIDCKHAVRYVRKSVSPPISHHAHVETRDMNVISNCYDKLVQTCLEKDCVSGTEKSYLTDNKQPLHLNNVKDTDPA